LEQLSSSIDFEFEVQKITRIRMEVNLIRRLCFFHFEPKHALGALFAAAFIFVFTGATPEVADLGNK
jgi:hypothetical protein